MKNKKKSLVWFTFCQYVLLPFAIVILLYLLASIMLELFGIDIFPVILKRHLGIANVFRLGNYFWVVICKIVYLILLLIFAGRAFRRAFHKAPGGLYDWIIFLLLSTFGIVVEVLFLDHPNSLFLAIFSNIHLLGIQNYFFPLKDPQTLVLLRFLKISAIIFSLIYFLVNLIYSINRMNEFMIDEGENKMKEELWICPHCGAQSDGIYCGHCGKKKEEGIQMVLPEPLEKKEKEEIQLDLAETKEKKEEEIALEMPTLTVHRKEEITDMKVDENPFAKKMDEEITLELPAQEEEHTEEITLIQEEKEKLCPNCSRPIDETKIYCEYCGEKLK